MQNKVVSYELCKELDELGFDCEAHTGWWDSEGMEHPWSLNPELRKITKPKWNEVKAHCFSKLDIKAYDCHDLLMWLKDSNKTWKLDYFCKNFDVDVVGNESEDQYDPENILFENDTYSDLNPANALAKAIIAILKEKKDGN